MARSGELDAGRGFSGGSDVWDTDRAGAVLSNDFFDFAGWPPFWTEDWPYPAPVTSLLKVALGSALLGSGKIFIGTNQVTRMYLGNTLIYQS